MTQIKDIATMLGEPAPDIMDETPEGIAASARFVWRAIRYKINPVTAIKQYRDGNPGHMWSGVVNKVLSELWPELEGGYREDPEKIKRIRLAINEYHRATRTLICRSRSATPPQWWVAEHWTGLTVTRKITQEKEETIMPDASPTAESTTPTMYPCRYPDSHCDYSTPQAQIRAAHELRVHQIRVQSDGSIVHVPQEKLTDSALQELILQAAEETDIPESVSYFVSAVQDKDPRSTKIRTRRMVEMMAASSGFDLIEFGSTEYYTRYQLATKAEEAAEKLVSQLVGGVEEDEADAGASGVELDTHIANVESLLAFLRASEAELNADLQARLEVKEAQLAEAKAELAKVVKERDQLQKTLNTIRTQIMGK